MRDESARLYALFACLANGSWNRLGAADSNSRDSRSGKKRSQARLVHLDGDRHLEAHVGRLLEAVSLHQGGSGAGRRGAAFKSHLDRDSSGAMAFRRGVLQRRSGSGRQKFLVALYFYGVRGPSQGVQGCSWTMDRRLRQQPYSGIQQENGGGGRDS